MNNTIITKKEFIFNWNIIWKDVENACKSMKIPMDISNFRTRKIIEDMITRRGYYTDLGVEEKLFDYVCFSFGVTRKSISADNRSKNCC